MLSAFQMAFLGGKNGILFEKAEGGVYNILGKRGTENHQLLERKKQRVCYSFSSQGRRQGVFTKDYLGLSSALHEEYTCKLMALLIPFLYKNPQNSYRSYHTTGNIYPVDSRGK